MNPRKASKKSRAKVGRVTSVDIAREAGVSQATVSRALNGGHISEATLNRITGVMDRLGYAPNASARALATSRSGLIGVVVADLTNPFYPELLEAIASRLHKLGMRMLLQNPEESTEEAATQLLFEQQVDGVIFTTAYRDSQVAEASASREIPIVCVNRVASADWDAVEADNVAGAMAVAEHLVGLGHERIAVIAGHPRASTSIARTSGFDQKLFDLGLAPDTEMRVRADYRYDLAYESMTALLRLPSPPTAVFCHNDLMAFAALNVARGGGLRVPDDISVVGFDDVRQAAWESIELTTVRQPVPEMATAAVELLERRLSDPHSKARHLVYPSRLIIRATTGPVPRSKRQ